MVDEVKCERIGTLTGGKWDKMHDIARRVYGTDGIAPTLHTCGGGNLEPKILEELIRSKKVRVRKLTPRECYRMMDFDDEDVNKVKAVNMSDTQMYKQAGNSIVVNVLMAIFKKMI